MLSATAPDPTYQFGDYLGHALFYIVLVIVLLVILYRLRRRRR
jgi:hypothetical protein